MSKLKTSLTIAALGIVFGDIGTSPLYSFREAATAAGGQHPDSQILGVLSLIVWTITLSVTFKYVGLVLRINNDGEGGILALSTLLGLHHRSDPRGRFLLVFGLLGAAMLFGDGVITPAISVLSAIEGLELAAPAIDHWVVPITVLVLMGLFYAQRFGAHSIASLFGPTMMVWFAVIGALGAFSIARNPDVLWAVDPHYGIVLLFDHPQRAALILAAVFLTITGGEALYADLGSFGRPAIARAWFLVAMPGLLLNYFGQGALVMADPAAIKNPFYLLAPGWLQLPLVVLASIATVIASQAVITGVFALTRQAMQVDLLPQLRVIHTTAEHEGHVYLPTINWLLAILSISAVLGFRSSDALADAYGMAVATAMITTTLLYVAALIHLGSINRYPRRGHRRSLDGDRPALLHTQPDQAGDRRLAALEPGVRRHGGDAVLAPGPQTQPQGTGPQHHRAGQLCHVIEEPASQGAALGGGHDGRRRRHAGALDPDGSPAGQRLSRHRADHGQGRRAPQGAAGRAHRQPTGSATACCAWSYGSATCKASRSPL